MASRDDEFYVGYAERPPPGVARLVRGCVIAWLALAACVALALAAFHAPPDPSVFEYGVERELVGWVREAPAPLLVVARPGRCDDDAWCAPAFSSWLLTEYGSKRGAHALVAGLDGRLVRLRGVLVYRDDQTLVDVVPGSVAPIEAGDPRDAAAPAAAVADLGEQTLQGEIVDSKCFFGVMRPGAGKSHRSCAARCIASGAPPVLVVQDAAGHRAALLLMGADGKALRREILPFVAEPVRVTGRVARIDHLLVLRTAPDAIRRL